MGWIYRVSMEISVWHDRVARLCAIYSMHTHARTETGLRTRRGETEGGDADGTGERRVGRIECVNSADISFVESR